MSELVREKDETTWPMVTVNILAFNRKDEVRITLSKIINDLDYPKDCLEIIVVDNASTDGTKEMVRSEFPEVKLIANDTNVGISAWNMGFKIGRGDYFLVLDDDSAPESGLKEAIAYLEQHDEVGVLACNIIGGAFTTDKSNLEHKQDWIGFIGCGAIITRRAIESVGGYADWIFVYAHEWEYGIRCLDHGHVIKYFEDCVVHHRASKANRSPKRLITYSTRNELLIVYKFFPKRRALFLMRVLCNNALNYRLEGMKALMHFMEGVGMFLAEARRHDRTYVKYEVQESYASVFWATKPVIPRLINKMARSLGNK